jgi:uncharacterized protein (TIGR03663 family)
MLKQSEIESQKDTPRLWSPDENMDFDGQISSSRSTRRIPRRSRRSSLSREQVLAWLPFGGVILLGALLRFWNLGDKPLHHDESLHAYYSLQLLHYNVWQWGICATTPDPNCYVYSPWLHGPFQFHAIALVYQIAQWLGAPDNGVNTTTVRIAAATLGTVIVGLPYFLRDYLGKLGAWLACFLLAVSPSMVYFSRFAREDIYYACFTLLMVVATLRYIRERKRRWLLLASAGLALSYATKETTFLSVAVFGAFTVGVIVWELGLRISLRERFARHGAPLPRTFAPLNLLAYLLVLGIFAKFFFSWLKDLSLYITTPANVNNANAFVQRLENITVVLVFVLLILLGCFVLRSFLRERAGKTRPQESSGLAAKADSRTRLLDTILTTPWKSWFYAFLLGWVIFLVLYTALFTNPIQGIGDGIWQGLYYWLQQQQVNRGGEPWYYYLLLIPLYEQVGVVFGLIGLVRSLLRPTRFRLFLVVWFLGSLFMYSWAAEKMPWLMIHIVLPLLLLAALGMEPCLLLAWRFVQQICEALVWKRKHIEHGVSETMPVAPVSPRRRSVWAGGVGCFGSLCAVLLLIPTLQNMYQVAYMHAADSQHEMMVYVQTTVYVNTVMDKIAAVDQQIDSGKHQLHIGVMNGAVWPFMWYLRDYPNACFGYPDKCQSWVGNTPVIIAGDDDTLVSVGAQLQSAGYRSHIYIMRGQFDQGYMPPPCVPTPQNFCSLQPYWGVGPGLWLSYGDNPPQGAKFNPILAAQHIWRWWWQRIPFGSSDGGDGGYNMELFIQKGINVTP